MKASLTIEEYPFEVFPQFSRATGELCQVLFRAADAGADRLERIREILTVCYGRPIDRGTKCTSVRHQEPEEMKPYERLIGDAMAGDATLFAREDSVEAAWGIVDPILGDTTPVYPYEPGTWGPAAADRIIARHGGWRSREPRTAHPPR